MTLGRKRASTADSADSMFARPNHEENLSSSKKNRIQEC
jgi:hypothetical protein